MRRRRSLPDNVTGFVDIRGKDRFRYRKVGQPTYYFKSHPGTRTHPSEEYKALVAGLLVSAPRAVPGTFNDLISRWYGTPGFNNLGEESRKKVRAILEDFRRQHGTKRVKTLGFQHIDAILVAKAAKGINAAGKKVGGPHAAKALQKLLRRLCDYAMKLGMIDVNPVALAEGVKVPKGGFHTWTEEEIAQFRRRHPLGSKARLALEIALWTLQRRADVNQFGPSHFKAGKIKIFQEKTQKEAWLPAVPQLIEAIEAMPAVGMKTFLVTEFGKPFTKAGLGNWFRDRCDEAGLPHCSLHGLRKATGRRLAERGATQPQIKAAGSWSNDKEVATYTAAADQRRLADVALTDLAEWELANMGPEVSQTLR